MYLGDLFKIKEMIVLSPQVRCTNAMEVDKHGKTLPLVLSILPALMAIVVIPYTVFTLRKFFKGVDHSKKSLSKFHLNMFY